MCGVCGAFLFGFFFVLFPFEFFFSFPFFLFFFGLSFFFLVFLCFCFFFFFLEKMLGFLTLAMVKGGIMRDAFTQKVALSGSPVPASCGAGEGGEG